MGLASRVEGQAGLVKHLLRLFGERLYLLYMGYFKTFLASFRVFFHNAVSLVNDSPIDDVQQETKGPECCFLFPSRLYFLRL